MTPINIQSLTYKYGDRTALSDISLELTERRIAIVGRNGSGKSTLAQAICGLIKPDTGKVMVNNVDVLNDRSEALNTVGIIFQNPDHQIIFPTVIEEIGFGIRQLGVSKQDAKTRSLEVLKRFNRTDWADRPVSGFSQGQRQLICLMSVIAMAPKVIVLDEPFSGLDIPTKRALQKRFVGLEQTLIHITHDPELVRDYDRLIWIENGEVTADGTPDTVLPDFLSAMEADDAGFDL